MTFNFSFIDRLPKSRLDTLQDLLLTTNCNQISQLAFYFIELNPVFLHSIFAALKIIPKFLKIYFDGFDMLLMFLMMYGISTIEAPLIIEILLGGDPKGGDFFWILKIE
jgi:hypothetical protein